MEWFQKLPEVLQIIIEIVGCIFTLLVTVGVLDRSNKVIKVYDAVSSVAKKFAPKEKQ